MAEAEAMLPLAQRFAICFSDNHFRGERNVLADILSRSRRILKAEWRLASETFVWV